MLRKTIKSVILCIFFIILGFMVMNGLKAMKKEVAKVSEGQVSQIKVTTQTLTAIQENVQVSNYGNIQPRVTLSINSELNGRILYIAPDLLEGNAIPKGTLLFKIDDQDYKLAQERAEIAIKAQNIALASLDIEAENIERNLGVLRKQLEITEKELKRYEILLQDKSVSPSEFNTLEKSQQAALAAVISAENSKRLLPTRREQIQAQIAQETVALNLAKANMARTTLSAPFTGRILKKYAELGQYVRTGDKLSEIYDTSSLEVKIPLSMSEIQWVLPEFYNAFLNPSIDSDKVQINAPAVWISLIHGTETVFWYGKLVRLGSEMDTSTRTLTAIVEIAENDPRNPKMNPRLLKGMFVKAVFEAVALQKIYKIPRNLVTNGNSVYLVKDGKLRIQPISIMRVQQDFVYVHKGIQEQDELITSILSNVVDGMPVVVMNSISEKQAK